MCKFERPELEPSEMGGRCVDRYLVDLEMPNWERYSGLWPCPCCNTRDFLWSARDEYQRALDVIRPSSRRRGKPSGKAEKARAEDYWKNAKACARAENPGEADEIIVEIEGS